MDCPDSKAGNHDHDEVNKQIEQQTPTTSALCNTRIAYCTCISQRNVDNRWSQDC